MAGATRPAFDRRAIAAVLAGGAGRRLGGAKASTLLGGRPLIHYPLAAAQAAGLEAIVVAKPTNALPSLRERIVREPVQPQHPLCGLVAALRFAAERSVPAVVALACDMPFVTGPLLAWLAELDGSAMAQLDGRPQPLLARVSASELAQFQAALHGGDSLTSAFAALAPLIVDERELALFGDPHRLCFNVNDRDDLTAAERWLS